MEEYVNQKLYNSLDVTLKLSISKEIDDYNRILFFTHNCFVCNKEINIKISKYSDFLKLTEHSVLCNDHKNMKTSTELKNYFYDYSRNICKLINSDLKEYE